MRKQIAAIIAVAAVLCTLAPAGPSISPSRKISRHLKGIDPQSTVDVIVQYRVHPASEHFERIHRLGGIEKRTYGRIPQAALTIPASALESLASDADVKFISPDRKVQSHLNYTAAAINANLVWQLGYDGKGIGVAVVDSGVPGDDQDLSASGGPPPAGPPGQLPQGAYPNGPGSRVVYAEDFTQPLGPAHYQAKDDYGHGTHVAGIIAGNATLSTGPNYIRTYKGIAPNANIISLRVLDQNGEGTDSTVIAAIDQAINLKNTFNIRVLNLSLGRPVTESFSVDPLCQAVEEAWKAGIVVVVAAGNDGRDNSFNEEGYGTISAPGNDPYVITVGAMKTEATTTRMDDMVTTYSAKGPTPVDHIVKPDIVAPGNLVASALKQGTLVQEYPQNVVSAQVYKANAQPNDSSDYFILSGTSMAAGVMSGAVADLLEAKPNLTPDQVKAVFMSAASKGFNNFGIDYYNASNAIPTLQLQIQNGNQQLPQLAQSLQQAQHQLNNDQTKFSHDNSIVQADSAAINTDQANLASAEAALSIAQANNNSVQTALTNAQNAQSTAQTSLSDAQSALQSAQKSYPGNSAQVQAAQANVEGAQAALQNAQNVVNAAQNVANQSQQKVQQAQQAVQQAQNQLNNDQNKYQNDSNQLAKDTTAVNSDNSAVASVVAQQNQIAGYSQQLVADQATVAQGQADPSMYGTTYDIFTVGAGYLDVNAAITSTSLPPTGVYALSPVAYIDPVSGQVMASGSYGTLCGNASLGGNSTSPLISAAFCSDETISNTTALWQFSSMAQSNSNGSTTSSVSSGGPVSGASSVWGTSSVWSASSVWGATLGNPNVNAGSSVWSTSSVWSQSSVWSTSSVWSSSSVWSASGTQAFSSVWSQSSVWATSTNGADSTDSATSVKVVGDRR